MGWLMAPWVRWGLAGCIIVALGATAFYFYRQSNSRSLSRRATTARVAKRSPSVRAARKPTASATTAPTAKNQSARAGLDRSLPVTKPGADRPQASPPIPTGPGSTTQDHPQPRLPRVSSTVEPSLQAQSGQAPVPNADAPRLPGRAVRSAEPAGKPAAATPALPQAAGTSKAAPSDSAANTSAAQEKKKTADTYENTPPLTDGRVKVQAIAWSPEVEDRMAVVNSRVVHEGDTLDDFFVVAIRPDDVVVREKEKGLWKVVFGRP